MLLIVTIISGILLTAGLAWIIRDDLCNYGATWKDILLWSILLLACWIPIVNAVVAGFLACAFIGTHWEEYVWPVISKKLSGQAIKPLRCK